MPIKTGLELLQQQPLNLISNIGSKSCQENDLRRGYINQINYYYSSENNKEGKK